MSTNKILLLTSDDKLSEELHRITEMKSLVLDSYPSLKALGRISELGNYALILVDDGLMDLTGNEVAQYVDVFFKSIPVIVLTNDPELKFRNVPWAASVKFIYNKKAGVNELFRRLEEASAIK